MLVRLVDLLGCVFIVVESLGTVFVFMHVFFVFVADMLLSNVLGTFDIVMGRLVDVLGCFLIVMEAVGTSDMVMGVLVAAGVIFAVEFFFSLVFDMVVSDVLRTCDTVIEVFRPCIVVLVFGFISSGLIIRFWNSSA